MTETPVPRTGPSHRHPESIMPLNRRNFLGAAALGAGSLMLGSAQAAPAPALPKFTPPTAKKPMALCFNENPLGLTPAARDAAIAALPDANRYPFVAAERLRKACADFMGGKPENVMLSHGSAESIRASIEAHIRPGVCLICPELTYSDGADTARKNNVKVVTVPMGAKWSVDLEAMKKTVAGINGPVIVYFVNPNNPTSTIVDSKALHDWIRSRPADVFFVIDEAYAGDIIGVFDPGIFSIGDTLCSPGKKFRFDPIPTFAPEHFARVRPVDTMKRKQFLKGAEQIALEGAIQIFKLPYTGMEEVIVGVVGTLQFDVFQYRLRNEYNVEIRMDTLPYEYLRWIKEPVEFHETDLVLGNDTKLVEDYKGNKLLLFSSFWSIKWVSDHNPQLVLTEFNEEDT